MQEIANCSLTTWEFASLWIVASVKPLLKKTGLNTELKNYRPVSNLSMISKLVESVALKQLSEYTSSKNLFPSYQSAYQKNHSYETALLKLQNDILWEDKSVSWCVQLTFQWHSIPWITVSCCLYYKTDLGVLKQYFTGWSLTFVHVVSRRR